MVRSKHFYSIIARLVLCVGAGVVLVSCAATDSPLAVRGPQRRMFAGPTAAFGINGVGGTFHSQTPAGPDCGEFTGGSGTGVSFGLALDYWFAQSLQSNGIIARIMYLSLPSTFTDDYGTVPFLNKTTQKPQNVSETQQAAVTYNLINIRLAYLYSIPATAFGIEVGPSIGIAPSMNVTQTLKISPDISPGVTFSNTGSTENQIYSGSPDTKSGLRFGLWVGGEYKISAGWWIIAPYLGYDIGLTKVLSTSSWSISSIVGGIDFKYGFK